jgi:hypothetical protein
VCVVKHKKCEGSETNEKTMRTHIPPTCSCRISISFVSLLLFRWHNQIHRVVPLSLFVDEGECVPLYSNKHVNEKLEKKRTSIILSSERREKRERERRYIRVKGWPSSISRLTRPSLIRKEKWKIFSTVREKLSGSKMNCQKFIFPCRSKICSILVTLLVTSLSRS